MIPYVFAAFAGVLVVSALLTILHRSPVTSALFLVLAFCSLAGIYLLLGAEFLGMVQVIVYAGAIMVLFLFVIMYLNLQHDVEAGVQIALRRGVGWLMGGVLAAEAIVLFARRWAPGPAAVEGAPAAAGNTQAVGLALYSRYLFPFEITSMILLVAMVGVIVAGLLEGRVRKQAVAFWGGMGALLGFLLIVASGVMLNQGVFYAGVVLLGAGTGLSTTSNLSLMLDMTVPGKVGLFIGAWGSASSFARLLGSLSTAIVRDMARLLPNQAVLGYAAGFSLLALFLIISLFILNRVNLAAFQRSAEDSSDASIVSIVDRARLANGES